MRLRVALGVHRCARLHHVTYTAVTDEEEHDETTDWEHEVEIAIVGSGFSGLAMAARLKRAGPRRLRDPRARAARSAGPGARTPIPVVAATSPATSTRSRSRPTPSGARRFSPQPEIHEYLRSVADRRGAARARPLRLRARERRLGRRARALAAADLVRHDQRPGADRRRRAAARAEAPRDPRPGGFRGHDLSLRDLGSRPRARRRARRGDRHRRQRDPVRAADPARGRAAAPVPAHRAVGDAAPPAPDHRGSSARPSAASRPCSGGCARRSTGAARRSRSRCCGSTLAPLLRKVGEAHLARSVADPELRAKLTPDYLPGCKRILVSNDYLPSLGRANVEVVCEGIAEVRGRTIVGADGSEREVDTIILGTGFHVLDMPIAERIGDGEGRSLAEHWDGSPQRAPRDHGRRLPQPLPAARPEHRAGPQLGRLHGRGAGRLRARRRSTTCATRGSRRSR